MTTQNSSKDFKHPFRVDYGPDPEIRDYMSHLYSIQGGKGEKGPALSDEQLTRVDKYSKRFDKIVGNKKKQTWDNVLSYLADHVALISGSFCGGTKFATNFLKAFDIRAGHEQIFASDGIFYFASMVGTQLDVEISGGITPWLQLLTRPAGQKPIDHLSLVRHPVDLINSRFYYNPPKKEKAQDTLEFQRDVATQLELNLGALPAYVWRVESEADQLDVLDIFGRKPSTEELSKARSVDRNSKKKGAPVITWNGLVEPLKDWASDLGYDKDGLKTKR